MKIADFFIALGFDIKGAPDLKNAKEGVTSLDTSSVKLLASVTALNAALLAMLTISTEVGSALKKWSIETGLNRDVLQDWQGSAVKAGGAAQTIVQSIAAIQKARAEIAFGNSEAAAPWMLLGIDPRQDPFKVLDQLRAKIKQLDPSIARNVIGQLGLPQEMLLLLRNPNFGQGLSQNLRVTDGESDRLFKVATAWKELIFTLKQVGARIFGQFGDEIEAFIRNLTKLISFGGQLADWLAKGSSGATTFKYVVMSLAVAIGGLSVALGLLALNPVVAWLVAMSVLLGALILIVNDFWTALKGGNSAFEWNDGLILTAKNVERLAWWMQRVIDLKDAFFKGDAKGGEAALGDVTGISAIKKFIDWNWRKGDEWKGGASVDHSGDINVNVMRSGNDDPYGFGRELGRGIQRELSDSLAQSPIQSK